MPRRTQEDILPSLPLDIEQVIWDLVRADVRKRLKAWQGVHRELQSKVPRLVVSRYFV